MYILFSVFRCRDPGAPNGAVKSGRSYNEGDIVFYSCKYGLKLFQGSKSRTCLKNKTWSGTPPKCVGKEKPFKNDLNTRKLMHEMFCSFKMFKTMTLLEL